MSKVKPKEEVFFLDPTNLAASTVLPICLPASRWKPEDSMRTTHQSMHRGIKKYLNSD
jgi:hypothetical protein